MAVRIENVADVDFGRFTGGAVTVTHIGFTKSGVTLVKELPEAVAVAQNKPFSIPAENIYLVFKSGDFPDSYIQARIWPDWNGQSWQLDARTDANTVVAVAGYSAQNVNNWKVSTEAD